MCHLLNPRPVRFLRCWLVVAFPLILATAARGQTLQPMRITSSEIVAGQPFGIGKITVDPGSGEYGSELSDSFQIIDSENRIFYPVISQRFIDRVLDFLDDQTNRSSRLTFWFLVRGDAPLTIQISGAQTITAQIEVRTARANAFRRLARQWWREYIDQAEQRARLSEFPSIVDSYLISMLGSRLGMETRRLKTSADERDPLRSTFDLLFDTESMQASLIADLMSGADYANHRPQVPLPPGPAWTPGLTLPAGESIQIEPLARAVPAECFYLRFGNWENQIWLRHLLNDYGGDLSRLIQLRSYRRADSGDFLSRLALQTNDWDELFGSRVVEDLAVIGSDFYNSQNASIGVLFQSKNDFFRQNLDRRRDQFQKENADNGVTLSSVTIAGSEVSLLISADQTIRSYLVSQGNLHLVTSSETLVRRLIEAHRGQRSLADEPSFRLARRLMPLDREDTLFVFVSERFFHNLLSPTYQIELRRRGYARAAERVMRCGQLAAACEGIDPSQLRTMELAGLLPPWPLNPDGQPEGPGLGEPKDEVAERLPLADVSIDSVTDEEAAWYLSRAQYFTEKIGRFDPIILAVKRFQLDDQRERLVLDARVAPFAPVKYDWLGSALGPATADRLVGAPTDVATFQISLRRDFLGRDRGDQFFQLFAAVQDEPVRIQPIDSRGIFQTLDTVRGIPAYLGARPNPSILDSVPLGFQGRPDAEGFTYSRLLDLWRLEFNEFALLGFDRERLRAARQQLHVEPADTMAQLRLSIRDLNQTSLEGLANSLFYRRAWKASLANVRLVNHVGRQFHLPAEVAWRETESLIGAQMVCPLNGEYQLVTDPRGLSNWVSSAWPPADQLVVPPQYQAALLHWFRGIYAEVIQTENQFVVHATMDVQRMADSTSPRLPGIELFKGFDPIGSLTDLIRSMGGSPPAVPMKPAK